jgi:hypothetical protein
MGDLSGWNASNKLELTVYHSKISADLTHYPLPVVLTSTFGSEVFDELESDDNCLKIAFTKADGTTELYAEVVHWDDATEQAVIVVSKSDWVLSASADTVFYLYYDKTHADNTAHVGKTSDLAELYGSYTTWDNNGTGYDGYTLRYVIPASELRGTAGSVKIKFGYYDREWAFAKCYIGHQGAGDDYDFDGNQVEVKCGGTSGGTITSGGLLSDAVTFDYDPSEALVLSFYFDDSAYDDIPYKNTAESYELYYKSGEDSAADTNVSGYGTSGISGKRAMIERIIVDAAYTAINSVYDSHYKFVHYGAPDPSITPPILIDSTSNAIHGIFNGSMTAGDLVSGQLGMATDYDGSDDYADLDEISVSSAWTAEILTEPDGTLQSGDGYIIFDGRGIVNVSGYWGMLEDNDIAAKGHAIAIGSYIYVAATFDGSSTSLIYEDGSECGSAETNENWGLDDDYWLGNGYSGRKPQMLLNIARVSDSVRSAAWVRATKHAFNDTLLKPGGGVAAKYRNLIAHWRA